MEDTVFELLKILSPDTSVEQILEKFDEEIKTWKTLKNRQVGGASAKYEFLLKLKAEIESNPRILMDHAERYRNKKNQQKVSLQERAKPYIVYGVIEEPALNKLTKEFEMFFSKEEILSIINARMQKKKEFKYKETLNGKKLEDFLFKQICEMLRKVGKKDLYQFLNVSHHESKVQIEKFRKALYEKNSAEPAGEKKDIINKLLGYCRDLLLDDSKRIDYDYSISNLAFSQVEGVIETISKGSMRVIIPEQYRSLLEECTRNGMNFDKAEYMIHSTAQKNNVSIIEPSGIGEMRICRFCGSLNDKNSTTCKDCGMPLEIKCPQCDRISVSFEEKRCTNCGFTIGDMPNALKSLKNAKSRLGLMNIDGAMQCCLEAEGFWPGYKGLADVKSKILSAIPPDPESLTATLSGNIVNLQWMCAKTKYIQFEYLVVRKADCAPNSPDDGVLVSITKDNKFADKINDAGISYYYAVYTRNGGRVVSQRGTKTQNPVLLAADLKGNDIDIDIKETQIGFSFNNTHAQSIVVFRDGQEIASITGNTYIDDNLKTGQKYRYQFVAIYVDNKGNSHPSNGFTLILSPTAPPKPVSLMIEDGDKEAKLSWSLPNRGTLSIFVSENPLPYHINDIVNLDAIKLPKLNVTGTSCVISKNFSGERYYLPLSIQGNVAVVGKIARLVSIVKPSDVRFDRNENFVMVRWSWNNTSMVRIKVNADNANPQIIDLESSKSASQYRVDFPKNAKSIKISIYSMIQSGEGGILLSDGVDGTVNLSLPKVTFAGVKKSWFGDKYTLELSSDSILPGSLSLLIAEKFSPNENLENQKSYLTISPEELKPGVTISKDFHYSRKMKGETVYFRLITTDQNLSKQVRIVPETRNIQ